MELLAPWLGLLGIVLVLKNAIRPARDRGSLIFQLAWALAFMLWAIFNATLHAAQLSDPRACLTVERRLTATDQEAQEGYFALGDGQERLMLIVLPESDFATFLRAKVSTQVRLVIDNEGGRCR